VVVGDLGELASERAFPCADDAPLDADAVRVRDCGRVIEPRAQLRHLGIEVRVERQLLRDDERCNEHDVCAGIGSQPAREIECVLGLGQPEQRHDDAAIADRNRAAREAAGGAKVGTPHRSSW
jgi:hypothetical protein